MNRNHASLRRIAGCAVLIAVAVILQYLEFAIGIMPSFLKFDFSDIPEIIASYAYGPAAGVLVTVFKNIIHMAVSQSGFVGELSNALLGICLVVPAGLIYQKRKNKKAALVGGLLGSVTMALICIPLNLLLIYPLYSTLLGFDEAAILSLYQAILPSVNSLTSAILIFNVPFTLVKGLADVCLCFVVYKRISVLLKGEH